MTLRESINRGFNLMVTTVLCFGGLAFGFVALSPVENDWGDRLDDIGLLVHRLPGVVCDRSPSFSALGRPGRLRGAGPGCAGAGHPAGT